MDLSGLPDTEQARVRSLLIEHKSVFANSVNDLGCTNLISHDIPLLDSPSSSSVFLGPWRVRISLGGETERLQGTGLSKARCTWRTWAKSCVVQPRKHSLLAGVAQTPSGLKGPKRGPVGRQAGQLATPPPGIAGLLYISAELLLPYSWATSTTTWSHR